MVIFSQAQIIVRIGDWRMTIYWQLTPSLKKIPLLIPLFVSITPRQSQRLESLR